MNGAYDVNIFCSRICARYVRTERTLRDAENQALGNQLWRLESCLNTAVMYVFRVWEQQYNSCYIHFYLNYNAILAFLYVVM